MNRRTVLILVVVVLVGVVAACLGIFSLGGSQQSSNYTQMPPAEEPVEEEPGDIPQATEMPMPTQTLPEAGSAATLAPTEEAQEVVIDLNTVYAEVVAGLPEGSALFNPPETMRLGKEFLVEVRVVPVTSEELEEDEEIIATLTVDMEDDRPVVVIPLKVSTVMSARLTGEDFYIRDLSQEEQIRTPDQPYVKWQWEVRPEKAGEQRLTLHLSVVVNAEGMGDKTHTTSETRTVVVSGNFFYALGRFMTSNWEWVVTAILLPVLGWGSGKVWGRIKR